MDSYSTQRISIGDKTFEEVEMISIKEDVESFHSFEVYIDARYMEPSAEMNSDQVAPQYASLVGSFIGKPIDISVQLVNAEAGEMIFKGIITNLNIQRTGDNSHTLFVFTGSGTPVSLFGASCIKVYENKLVRDIVKEKLDEQASITQGTVAPNYSTPLEYIVQYEENDWNFVKRLCGRLGEWLLYDGAQLHVGSLPSGATHALEFRKNLMRFNIGMHTLPSQNEVVSWSYDQVSNISKLYSETDVSSDNPYYTAAKDSGESVYGIVGMTRDIQGHTYQSEEEELMAEVAAAKQSLSVGMTQLSGMSLEPGLKPGDTVTIREELETEGSVDYGTYLIYSVQHSVEKDHYSNQFQAVPVGALFPAYSAATPVCELQTALVQENYDPEGMGRLRVEFPWADGVLTPWVRMTTFSGGADKGFTYLPEIGEEVLVNFEGGNPERPIVVGSFFNGQAKSGISDPDNNIKKLQTRAGHAITLDDTEGTEMITIEDPNGNTILINTSEDTISITSNSVLNLIAPVININGEDEVNISSASITIDGSDAVVVNSAQSVAVNSDQTLTMAGAQTAELTAANVTVSADMVTSIEGTMVNINS